MEPMDVEVPDNLPVTAGTITFAKPWDPSFKSDLPDIVKAAQSNILRTKFDAVYRIRRALSTTRDPPINTVINGGVLSTLVDCLYVNCDVLKIEAAWALANLAAGDSETTATVVASGVIPAVAKVLKRTENWDLVFQLLWILGNVIGESPLNRSECILNGVLDTLKRLVERDDVTPKTMNNVCWVLVNIARCNSPKLAIVDARKTMMALWKLTKHEDQAIVADAIWGLHYIADASKDHTDLLLEAGCIPEIVAFMGSSDGKIVWPAVHTMGTICRGTDNHIDAAIEAGVLKKLPHAFKLEHWKVTKDALWLMASIATGLPHQVEALIASGVLRYLTKEAHDRVSDTTSESIDCLANLLLFESLTDLQVKKIIDYGAASALSALLEVDVVDKLELVLKSMLVILERAGDETRLQFVRKQIEEYGGLEYIENLQAHDKEEIYHLAYEIYDEHFPEESNLESQYRAERGRAGKPRYEIPTTPSVPPTSPGMSRLDALRFGEASI